MEIVTFQMNDSGSSIILELENAENATTLRFWNNYTYKDYDKVIDLSSLLTLGEASQTIEITASDINESYFNGIFFIQVESTTEIVQSLTSYLVKYKECILEKLAELGVCDDCLKTNSISLINSQSILTGIEYSVEQGFIEEAQLLILALDKYCSNDCKSCGKYENILNNNYYDYNTD